MKSDANLRSRTTRRKLLVLAVIALVVVAVGAKRTENASAATAAETSAVNWALRQLGQTKYEGASWALRCLPFVENAYADGVGPRMSIRSISHPLGGWNANTDPQDVWGGTFSAGTTGGSSTTPPYGALVFFDAKPGYQQDSRVEIMGPDGEMIGTRGKPDQAVFEETLAQHEGARDYNTYVGWWLPDGAMKSPSLGTQLAELKGSDTAFGDSFGYSVAISGTTAVVGAYEHDHYAGRAYVFTQTAAGWKQVAELKGSDTAFGDAFGYSVAISGTTIVVGSIHHAEAAGRVYVFTETASGWKQIAELKGSDTVAHDGFGRSVAISGRIVVIGAPFHARDAGRAYVFAEEGTVWKQGAELLGSDTVAGDEFGGSVAVWGATILVGSTAHAEAAGRAYVFAEEGTVWKQAVELKGSGTVAGDEFGGSVAVSGTTAVVGAHFQVLAGRAYVFTQTASGWTQVAVLKGSDTVADNDFGNSVAISGTTLIVGTDHYDPDDAGRAYVFTKTATGWTQVAELQGSDTVTGNFFGWSVAISGTTAVVGAWYHAETAGRAYVFEA